MPRAKPGEQRNVTPGNDGGEQEFLDDLQSILNRFPDSKKAYIRRCKPDGVTWSFLARVPAAACTEEYIQKRFGGGTYQIQFADARGQFTKMVPEIEIESPDDAIPSEATEPAAALPAPGSALPAINPMEQILQMVREENARMHLITIKMIETMGQREPAQQSDIGQMIGGLIKMQELIPKAAASIPEQLTMRAFDILGKQASAPAVAGSDGSFGSEVRMFLTDVVKELVPQLMGKPAIKPAVNAPAAIEPGEGAAEETEMTMDEAFQQALDYMFDKYQKGRTPAVVGEMVIMMVEQSPEMVIEIRKRLRAPMDDLLEIEPRLKDLKYRQWFTQIFEVLRVQFLDSEDNPKRATGS